MKFLKVRFLVRAYSRMVPHLAIFAVMLLALASNGTSSWQCQGRDCGVTPWTCCCAQPNNQKDDECRQAQSHFQSDDHALEVSACALTCHCSKVLQDQRPSVSSAPFALATPLLFVVTRTFAPVFETPTFTESVGVQPSRGPPPRKVCLALTCLRGPPSPDVFRTFEPEASARV